MEKVKGRMQEQGNIKDRKFCMAVHFNIPEKKKME